MKIRWFTLMLIGAIAGLSACNRQDTASLPPSPDVPQSAADTTVPAPQTPAAQAKPGSQPTVQAAAQGVAPIPVPELIPPTASLQRLPQIEVGRADPFAALPVTPTVIPKPAPEPAAANSPMVVPLPPVTIAAPLPIAQPNLQPGVPNAIAVPPAPRPVSPTHLAEAIEISGVMEVGGKTNIIVNVPNEGTSRSVRVGDSLANGQVRVKRVEMGLEPIVVLEQNGREVTRSVGSGAMVGLI